MPAGGNPIDSAVVARVSGQQPSYSYGGTKVTVNGVNTAWMSPGQPLSPLAAGPNDQTRGRQFDFPVNINLVPRARSYEQVSFAQLRALADNCDVLRLVIENEKDNLAKLKWKVKPRDEKKQSDDRCKQLMDFFALPDQEHTWDEWLRMLLEDLFVIDAPALFPVKTNGGDVDPSGAVSDWYGFEPVDGATIKRIITPSGRTPLPPDPAYQQILKGLQATDYTRDELIYRPRNVRTNRIYGYSPVEQILTTVNISIRRAMNQLSYYTEGNVPDLIFGVPDSWQPDQISQFQTWWDSLTSGQTKHKGRFVPAGVKPYDTKEIALKDDFDEWLARIVCYAFSTQPTPFIKAVNRSTAENAQQEAQQEGLLPRMNWIRNLLNFIIWKYFGFTDLEFDWDQEEAMDPLEATQIDDINVRNGTKSVDEIRQARGDKTIGMSNAVYTATGPVSVDDFDKQQDEKAKQTAALAEAAAKNPPPAPGEQPPSEKPPVDTASGEKPPTDQPADGASKFSAQHFHKGEKKKPGLGTDVDASHVLAAEKAFSTLLADFFAEQAPKIAKQLSTALGLSKAEDDPRERATQAIDSLNFDTWQSIVGKTSDVLAGVAVDSGSAALDKMGITDDAVMSLMRRDATDWASANAAAMVGMKYDDDGELVPNPDATWQITESTRDMLRSTTQQALDEGWSTDEFADAIADSYAFSEGRAQTIARTETAKADVAGHVEGWKATGQVEQKEWQVAEGCCDECQELDGQTVDIGEPFPDGGGDGPPLHPNCRCNLLPVLTTTDNDTASDDSSD